MIFKNNMNFKEWIIKENINQMVVYHRTTRNAANMIMQSGFDISKAVKFELGKGVYVSQYPSNKWDAFDPVNIQCELNNISEFLDVRNINNRNNIFNDDEIKQLREFEFYIPQNTYTSALMNKVMTNYKGIIAKPMLIVIYNPQDIIPKKVIEIEKQSSGDDVSDKYNYNDTLKKINNNYMGQDKMHFDV